MGCTGSKAAAAAASPAIKQPPKEEKKAFAATYELKEKMGKGQYAVVHKAVKKADGTICAVKCIKKDALTKEDLEALTVEVKAMEMLRDHPNFVRYYDFFSEKDYFFLCMELITGGELFDRICEKEKYSEREARVLMYQLASGIAYAHAKGIAHRDLKPENILLKSRNDDTSIKLADLGFAKVLTAPSTQLMTTPCGTPGYVAPEVISGKPYGLACDVWSLGVIFFILLCGYPPFAADDGDQNTLFAQIKAGAYKFDPAEWSVVSDGAKDLVRKVLVVDPAKRLNAAQILAHPWMKADAAALPAVSLQATVAQLKRFNARRKLKAAMRMVRSTVRMKMMLASRAVIEAKKQGASVDEQEKAFYRALSANKNPATTIVPLGEAPIPPPTLPQNVANLSGAPNVPQQAQHRVGAVVQPNPMMKPPTTAGAR